MADSGLRSCTHQQLQDALGQLEEVWDNLGLSEDQRQERTRLFYGHVTNLCEKILEDERALKARIINRIEKNTICILKLSEELCVEPEEAVDGLTLLELDSVLQERVEKLQETRAERREALRNLQEKDEGLCELLCETPYFIPSGLVPSLQDLQAVEEHIKTMEKEKNQREATFRKLKGGLMTFLEQLEQTPDDSFSQEILCSDDEDIPLGQAAIQHLKTVHSNLEFRVQENIAKSMELRERIVSLWTLLEVSKEDQQAFLATAPKHTPSNIAKLEEELERLKVLRLQNLSVFADKLREELQVWWEKCYVGLEERDRVTSLSSGEAGEEVLVVLEEEVERWRQYHDTNSELLATLDHFIDLFNQMLELEERSKDPGRLFNTRGGVLLQEEKAKKKVKNELPRVQERLEVLAQTWEEQNGVPFTIYGQEVVQYIDHLWNTHRMKKEVEKNQRLQAKEGKRGPGAPPQIRTPGPTPGRKRGVEGEEPTCAKKSKHLTHHATKSPSKTIQRSPLKEPTSVNTKLRRWPCSSQQTPRGKPLAEHNAFVPPAISSEADCSIQSITYDKFKADIVARRGEVVHSSFLEDVKPRTRQAPKPDHLRARHLRDTLHLASPVKWGSRGEPRPRPMSPIPLPQGSLRRTASQPCLCSGHPSTRHTARLFSPRYYGNPKFFSNGNKDYPRRFLI